MIRPFGSKKTSGAGLALGAQPEVAAALQQSAARGKGCHAAVRIRPGTEPPPACPGGFACVRR